MKIGQAKIVLLLCVMGGGSEATEAGLVTAGVTAGVAVVAGRREDAEDAEVAAGGRETEPEQGEKSRHTTNFVSPPFINILFWRGSADCCCCCCCALERERALEGAVVAAEVTADALEAAKAAYGGVKAVEAAPEAERTVKQKKNISDQK